MTCLGLPPPPLLRLVGGNTVNRVGGHSASLLLLEGDPCYVMKSSPQRVSRSRRRWTVHMAHAQMGEAFARRDREGAVPGGGVKQEDCRGEG